MGRMYSSPHPGETIREDIIPALGLSVTKAARELGVSRVALSRVLYGKASISPAMALRLEAWLDGPKHGPDAESWLRGQLAYDLWQAERAPRPRVQPACRWGASAIQPRTGTSLVRTTASRGIAGRSAGRGAETEGRAPGSRAHGSAARSDVRTARTASRSMAGRPRRKPPSGSRS